MPPRSRYHRVPRSARRWRQPSPATGVEIPSSSSLLALPDETLPASRRDLRLLVAQFRKRPFRSHRALSTLRFGVHVQHSLKEYLARPPLLSMQSSSPAAQAVIAGGRESATPGRAAGGVAPSVAPWRLAVKPRKVKPRRSG